MSQVARTLSDVETVTGAFLSDDQAYNRRQSLFPAIGESEPRPIVKGGRVLVIDDELILRRSIERVLKKLFNVVLVDGGPAALDLLATDQAFDVVLCDMRMDGVNGQGVYEFLQHSAPDLLDRLVFLSGAPDPFLSSVPNLVLNKPIEISELRAVVGRVRDKYGVRSQRT